MGITLIYTFISILIAAIDLIIAAMSFSKKTRTGKYLGLACIIGAIVDCAYLVTVTTDNYFINSVFASIYFAGISALLNVLLIFVFLFTNTPRKELVRTLIKISCIYLAFEIIIFAINPFKEIVIGYLARGGVISRFGYYMEPLYWMHLIYSYILIAGVLFMLVYAAVRVAKEYKAQYIFCALALGLIVFINAIFLFIPHIYIISRLDISVFLYSLGAFVFYWACFVYPKQWMEGVLKNSIFDSLDLGIVLFGYNDRMIFYNEKIKGYLPFLNFEQGGDIKEFLSKCDMELNEELSEENYSFQWYHQTENGNHHPYFVDHKRLKNEKGRNLGRLLIFEDAILESDPMTGFHNLEPFEAYANHSYFEYPVVIACVDINSLSVINNTYGRSTGDQLILELADKLKSEFPLGTYFIRGTDAKLIAVCNNAVESEVNKTMFRVREQFSGTFQYSVIVVTQDNPDMVSAIEQAETNVSVWKLMDKESIRSDTLNSLIRALKECDEDTEAHVHRTQNMGIELSRRMGLADSDEVNLALLCVLHDIGKIGIPLEILNKPGKLTDEEWELMKSHVQKGYDIAMSSTDYMQIADAILHHHERWDGQGYPDGLSKETIPLLSRFIAVIDSYDAMVSERPYKKALSKEDAIGELLKNAGTQFDPAIVNEFVQMIAKDEIDLNADIFNLISDDSDEEDRPNSARYKNHKQMESEEVHAIPYARYILDKDYNIIRWDNRFNELTGYDDSDLAGRSLAQGDLIPERNRALYFAVVAEQIGKHQIAYFEHSLVKKDGSEISVVCLGRTYFDSAVNQERSEIIVFDITQTDAASRLYHIEKQRAENRLEVWEKTFRKDSLTGLYNHSAFVSEVELKLIDRRYKTVFLMIDVDNFKVYNDTYGHRNGDEFLIILADAINDSLRDTDVAGRLGGDEFAAAMFFPAEVADDVILTRVHETFDSIRLRMDSVENSTTFSMGVSIAEDIKTFKELYDAADQAMYGSKNAGRNRLSIHENK